MELVIYIYLNNLKQIFHEVLDKHFSFLSQHNTHILLSNKDNYISAAFEYTEVEILSSVGVQGMELIYREGFSAFQLFK